MLRVAIKTLGCKVNTYESDAIWELFKAKGYKKVLPTEEADVYVINTCSVTNTGDKKSRQTIRRMIRINPDAVVVAMGCYAQLKPEEVSQIEGVDIVLGTQGREDVVKYVEQYLEKRQPIVEVTNIMKQKQFEELDVVSFESQTRAFIKIQEGCNNFCTFCIIPWARGLLRSQEPQKVIKQITELVENGVKEVVLTGIHTAGYGEDLEEYTFAMLLKEIDQIPGLERIRISSIETSQITEDVIEVFKNSTKIVNHLHVPIQAGSNEILKKMRRHYTTGEFIAKLQEIKNIFPDMAFTTDIIVGFPGETDELFAESVETLKTIGFSELHVFPYSVRAGTPAARMDNQVPEFKKKERVHKLLELNNELALKYANDFENDIVEVLVERVNKDGKLEGHSSNYLRVEFAGDHSLINQIVNVELTEINYPKSKGNLIKN